MMFGKRKREMEKWRAYEDRRVRDQRIGDLEKKFRWLMDDHRAISLKVLNLEHAARKQKELA